MSKRYLGWIGVPSLVALAGIGLLTNGTSMAQMKGDSKDSMKTSVFSGKKVNRGTVMHEHKNGMHVLVLSDDFEIPDTPDPHWQVVDSAGNSYLLQRLNVKGTITDKVSRSITVPPYVRDIAKVQIWCGYAEVVLGEGSFQSPIR